MAEIGVRELKAHASEILRRVRDQRARYLVTYRGRPVGLLLPLEGLGEPPLPMEESTSSAWEELVRLGEEIGRGWQSPLTGAELLSEMRR